MAFSLGRLDSSLIALVEKTVLPAAEDAKISRAGLENTLMVGFPLFMALSQLQSKGTLNSKLAALCVVGLMCAVFYENRQKISSSAERAGARFDPMKMHARLFAVAILCIEIVYMPLHLDAENILFFVGVLCAALQMYVMASYGGGRTRRVLSNGSSSQA